MSEIECTYLVQRYMIIYCMYAALLIVFSVIILCYSLHTPDSSTDEDAIECQDEKGIKLAISCIVVALSILFVLPTPKELSSILSQSYGCSVSK